jgi:hypothetical protein
MRRAAAVLVLFAGGCGASYAVSVRNESGAPLVMEMVGTEEAYGHPRADVAEGGTFEYVMSDERRMHRGLVRMSGEGMRPAEIDVPDWGSRRWVVRSRDGGLVVERAR